MSIQSSLEPAKPHLYPADRIRILERQVARLTAELAAIKRIDGVPVDARRIFNLGKSENIILSLLMKREFVSGDALRFALYAHRPGDPPETNTVAAFLCSLRKKLPAYVKIKNEIRLGWSISAEHKKLLRAEMAAP